jgi:hypothetical protein
MKRTNCGRWCHSACAHWTPETVLDRETGLICGVRHISKVSLSPAKSRDTPASSKCIGVSCF